MTKCSNCGFAVTHAVDCDVGLRQRAGYYAAKRGEPRDCPLPWLPQYEEEIAAWYLGYDDYEELQK